ncbi:kinase-like domain-containing protein [Mycena vulgaris]|nr:kinase-like domain-containing protein [Mycena vulgaris]
MDTHQSSRLMHPANNLAKGMQARHSKIQANQSSLTVPKFDLECGTTLRSVDVVYKTWRTLNVARDNVMVICHALTGSVDVNEWWKPFMGRERAFDPARFFSVCANVLGSPYGTSLPVSINPSTGRRYGTEFPPTTIRDDASRMTVVQSSEHKAQKKRGIFDNTDPFLSAQSYRGMRACSAHSYQVAWILDADSSIIKNQEPPGQSTSSNAIDTPLTNTGLLLDALDGRPCSISLPRLLVYQNLLSLIQDVSRATEARIHDTLGAVSAEDAISTIVKSRDWRNTLLQFANELGISGDDERLRDALRKDEEQIANFIWVILSSDTERAAVLRLEGDSAQYFLDVVQDVLHSGYGTRDECSKARRIINKLSEACDKLPSFLFITGVVDRDEYPTFVGGFGDIYRASYARKPVALKRVRIFRGSKQLPSTARDEHATFGGGFADEFCREALVWQNLQHPFILPLIGIDREPFPTLSCLVSPWMAHGTVLKFLNDYRRANVIELLSEIAQGLQYLHLENIVHGDLRGANILVTHVWSVALADFGLTSVSGATITTYTRREETVRWMAPELISPEIEYVCIELYTLEPPSYGATEDGVPLSLRFKHHETCRFKMLKGDGDDSWAARGDAQVMVNRRDRGIDPPQLLITRYMDCDLLVFA